MRLRVGALAMCSLLALGCGGHQPPKRHFSDDLAYLEIARASASLRAGVVSVAVGHARRISKQPELASAAGLVRRLRPRDGDLITARQTTQEALHAALSAPLDPHSQRSVARAVVHSTELINRRLRSYAADHPSVQSLIPD